MTARLDLLAHGASAATRAARFPDDEALEASAVGALEKLKGRLRPYANVLTSPARAARETAAALGFDAEVEMALIDCDYGRWRGLASKDVAQCEPDAFAAWLGNPAGVRQGDRAAIDGLLRGLVMSGLAMQAHGNSRPASGSDHQFAHLWEMEEIKVDGQPVSHGACVGVGCLSMLAAYDWLQRQDVGAVDAVRLAAQASTPQELQAEVAR